MTLIPQIQEDCTFLLGGHSLALSFLAVNTKDEYDQIGVYGIYMGKDHLLKNIILSNYCRAEISPTRVKVTDGN